MNSAPHIPVTRVECEARYLVCLSSPIPMRSQAICPFLMTTGGIDDESVQGSDRLHRAFSLSTLCSRSCANVCRHSFMVKEQPPCGSNYWRPIDDPHCPRLASRVFSVLKLQKTRGMLVVLSCLMAGEPYLRRQPDG
ncbi:unnamed protein product [Penicillium nalgiovense]|uniref:Uncharacterized protein n=1 Tax=Penicillium nalgiovense TaxID=60175 RepID=A0A9W4HPM4_PENNA|nr:unnamed protein product [Penicillium nalgiovense]CAG8026011.1 unnamed protein product [Penicillium nalgiovense]CAG8032116.1 unnamed protein product [Penicillium nalgiovense]CAG8034122.1 unnamed protein product [Penicillium nalgiovense]CAG8039168.1 unnamed protein product [Penicillium nalgiovense]